MDSIERLIVFEDDASFSSVAAYELGAFDHTLLGNSLKLDAHCLDNVLLTLSAGQIPDFIPNPLSWLICSKRVVKFFTENNCDVQILDCPMKSDDGTLLDTHRVINVLQTVDFLNQQKSDLDFDEGQIDMVYTWVFDSRKVLDDVMIFRDSNFKYGVFLNRRLARCMPAFKGVAFLSCDIQ
jgi:hypothetical protein